MSGRVRQARPRSEPPGRRRRCVPPPTPSTRSGMTAVRQVTPATPRRVVGGGGDGAGDVGAVKAAARRASSGRSPGSNGSGSSPSPSLARVGLADEIEARHQAAGEVGMVAPDAGVDDGDDRASALPIVMSHAAGSPIDVESAIAAGRADRAGARAARTRRLGSAARTPGLAASAAATACVRARAAARARLVASSSPDRRRWRARSSLDSGSVSSIVPSGARTSAARPSAMPAASTAAASARSASAPARIACRRLLAAAASCITISPGTIAAASPR